MDVKKYDVLFVRNPYVNQSPKYLPQAIKFAKKFKAAGKRVIDSNISDVGLGRGKWFDYQQLKKAGLSIPKTKVLPAYNNLPTAHYPLILKWNYGLKAKDVFLVHDDNQFKKFLALHPKTQWLAQEFVKADYEYKIIVVGYKALPVVLRFEIQDSKFKIHFAKHWVIKKSSIPKIIKLAEQAAKTLGRELAKVDILQKGKRLYILEVNRFPGLDPLEKIIKFNVAREFVKYLSRP